MPVPRPDYEYFQVFISKSSQEWEDRAEQKKSDSVNVCVLNWKHFILEMRGQTGNS